MTAADVRAGFIRRTYGHLAGAILAFVLLEALLFQTAFPEVMMGLLGTSRYSWLIVLLAFMGVSHLADNWARSSASVKRTRSSALNCSRRVARGDRIWLWDGGVDVNA